MKIVVFSLWMGGSLPPWMDPLVENRNKIGPLFEWHILGDKVANHQAGSVYFHHLPPKEFHRRIKSVGVTLGVSADKRKPSEMRPLYGELFADRLTEASHWGWSDLDVIFGRLLLFWPPEVILMHDVLALDIFKTSGSLTLVRNGPVTNKLWTRIPKVQELLAAPEVVSVQNAGFGKAVSDAFSEGRIRALFGPRPSHDREHSKITYNQDTGALYDSQKGVGRRVPEFLGREVCGYHFPKRKRWPV